MEEHDPDEGQGNTGEEPPEERKRRLGRERTRAYRERRKADPAWKARFLSGQRTPAQREAAKEHRRRWLEKPGVREKLCAQRNARRTRRLETEEGFRERVRKRCREWRQRNRNEQNEKLRVKFRDNPQYRVAHNLRVRLRIALRRVRAGKVASALVDTGCTLPELVQRLERQWLPGMSWENYGNSQGQWSIDHIRPLAAFDLTDPEQQRQACHFSNLRPLWHVENLRKWRR